MGSLAYASPNTGLISGAIGWLNLGVASVAAGSSLTNQTAKLRDGSTFNYNFAVFSLSGTATPITANPTNGAFGVFGYTGINSNVALYTNFAPNPSTTRVLISNMSVVDPFGVTVPDFYFYAVDSEGTLTGETMEFSTNGPVWTHFTDVSTGQTPVVTGLGTSVVRYTGGAGGNYAPMIVTTSPTAVAADLYVPTSGRLGIAFGISLNKVGISETINYRYNVSDQFDLNIVGNISATTTTYGSSNGLQSASAYVFPTIPGSFTLSQAMSGGSITPLTNYSRSVALTNLTPGGSAVPSTMSLPGAITLANGDMILATITNGVPIPTVTITKSAPSFVDVLNPLQYSVVYNNSGPLSLNNVVLIDTIPTGTSFVANSLQLNGVNVSGSPAPPSGINLGTLPVGVSTVTFNVNVSTIATPSAVTNVASSSHYYNVVPTLTVATSTSTTTTTIASPKLYYANANTGLISGAIGWIYPGFSSMASGTYTSRMSLPLRDGSILSFSMAVSNVSGILSPINTNSAIGMFGANGYTGITGNVSLWSNIVANPSTTRITLSNISVVDSFGVTLPNFYFYIVDSEGTGSGESMKFVTNGTVWSNFTNIGTGVSPVVTGLGTNTVTYTGASGTSYAPMIVSSNPSTIIADLIMGAGQREGTAFGISTNKVEIREIVGYRYDASDQFHLSVNGNISADTITYGITNGLQSVSAYVFPTVTGTFTLSQSMSGGSVTPLTNYTRSVALTNLTPGGSAVPSTMALPGVVTLANGDMILATITNGIIIPTVTITKSAPSFVDVLNTLQYTIVYNNSGPLSLSNVVLVDTIPTGTSFVANSVQLNGVNLSGSPAPPSGINLGTLPVGVSTVTFNVNVSTIATPTAVTNIASSSHYYNIIPTVTVGASTSTTTTTIASPKLYYANANTGLLSGAIGWIYPGFSSMASGTYTSRMSLFLRDGSVLSFSMAVSNVSGILSPINATSASGMFGSNGYTGITGNVSLWSNIVANASTTRITLSNISVVDSFGVTVPNFYFYIVDSEGSSAGESMKFVTNGTVWSNFTNIGTGVSPVVTGVGTNTVTYTGGAGGTYAPMIVSSNPSAITADLIMGVSQRQGTAFGISVNKIEVREIINSRYDLSDQFKINVDGNISATTTTFGSISGVQSVSAYVFPLTAGTFTLSQAMAVGSFTSISNYTQSAKLTNLTPGGTVVPSTMSVPGVVTLANGDMVLATITSTIIPLTVSSTKIAPTFADVNDVLTYTIAYNNYGPVSLNNVVLIDTIPSATNFVSNSVNVNGVNISGNPIPPNGINLGTLPAGLSTITFNVSVSTIPGTNPMTNIVSTSYNYNVYPTIGAGSSNSNIVSTTVSSATISAIKSTNLYSTIGTVITYTIPIRNYGNTSAYNVIFRDTIPTGTTFVDNSVSINGVIQNGLNPSPPIGITLGTIVNGATTTVSFKVLVTSNLAPNPISNSAFISYDYTVNPTVLRVSSKVANTNVAITQFNLATLSSVKTADKNPVNIGEILNYSVAITNSGNVTANNIVFIDTIPSGTYLVSNSFKQDTTNISGSPNPPGVTLPNGLGGGKTTTVTFQVFVETVPVPKPIINNASMTFKYTSNPSIVNANSGFLNTNTVTTPINHASFEGIRKYVDKEFSYVGDTITYTIVAPNSGNITAVNIVFMDTIPNGTTFITNSVTVDGITLNGISPVSGIPLSDIGPGSLSTITFKVKVG